MENIQEFVQKLRESKLIKEKVFGNISSFNFTRKAFQSANWDSVSTKARGLFINTHTEQIVARSYDKFFAMGERPETQKEILFKNLSFPVCAYVKENGYLGILGYDGEKDELLFCSKSMLGGEYAANFERIFKKTVSGDSLTEMRQYLKESRCTLTFEVIDPVHDPHIIEYPKEMVFLLDIIKNEETFSNLPYSDVVLLGRRFGIPVKSVAAVLSDTKELLAFYDEVRCNDCLFQGRHIEGFVLQDVTGYMFKIKLPYYKFWKTMRSVSEEIRNKGHSKREAIFTTKEEKDIYGFLLNNIIPGSEHKINIIQLRNQFYAGQDK